MKTPTLDQQFLSHLSSEQKGQVWQYYLLITNTDLDPEQQVEQISEIWQRAASDERLMEWLEFIDYCYTNVDEADLPSAAQRAYLSEYLTEKVGLMGQETDYYGPRFLRCPHGKGYAAISRDSGETNGSTPFDQQRCQNCGYEFGLHQPVGQDILQPET